MENKKYIEKVVDINSEGQAVVKVDNFTVFLNEGVIGDTVEFEIIEKKKNFGIGKTSSIIEKSEYRVEAKCKYADRCGGCQIQDMDYDYQLKFKREKVVNDLSRLGGFKDIEVLETIGMEEPFRYRNKVQIPVGFTGGNIITGFYEKGSRRIVNRSVCLIQSEIADKAEQVLKDYMNKYKVRPYNSKQDKGFVRHLVVRNNSQNDETMIILVTTKGKIEKLNELIENLKTEIPSLKSFVQNINNRRSGEVLGFKSTVLYGEDHIVDTIGDLKFKIAPESFYQVNPVQTEKLYKKALEFADLKGEETVLDIYCGIGTISLFLAENAKQVYGIESVKQAVVNAKENAKLNNIKNVKFFEGMAEEQIPKMYEKNIRPDIVVLDPPRKGADEIVLKTIVDMDVKKIVYVSCNPSTLARDLKYLNENGYKIEKVQPVDMFGNSVHVECIALIQKKTI